MPEEYKIEIISDHSDDSEKLIGATERVASQKFREFTPEEIAASYNNELSLPTVTRQRFQLDLSTAHPYAMRRLWRTRLQLMDMYQLCGVIGLPFFQSLIRTYPERFQIIANTTHRSSDELVQTFQRNMEFGSRALQDMIGLAFIPKRERVPSQVLRDFRMQTILDTMPDLTSLPKEDRLDQIIAMLTMTHRDALHYVCPEIKADSLARLKTDDIETYKKVCNKAGNFIAENTFYGVLTDAKHGGRHNALKYLKEKDGDFSEQKTGSGVCPAASFMRNYFPGVGMALDRNKERVLELIV